MSNLCGSRMNTSTGKQASRTKERIIRVPAGRRIAVLSLPRLGKRLGVYMLRPPEHGQILLANAQAEWFRSPDGKQKGWRSVRDAHDAQSLANRGNLVVVVFESPDAHRPGHIAVIRPAHRPTRLLEENGPEITQAGQRTTARPPRRWGSSHIQGHGPGECSITLTPSIVN